MIEHELIPVVKAMYNGQFKEIFQDDCAVIHRCREALEACKGFDSCSPHDVQAAKLADVWPVKNVWGILQQRVKKREPESKEQLRRNILEEWQYIDDDKAMCRKLIESISKRLQAVLDVDGSQTRKKDNNNNVAA